MSQGKQEAEGRAKTSTQASSLRSCSLCTAQSCLVCHHPPGPQQPHQPDRHVSTHSTPQQPAGHVCRLPRAPGHPSPPLVKPELPRSATRGGLAKALSTQGDSVAQWCEPTLSCQAGTLALPLANGGRGQVTYLLCLKLFFSLNWE